MEDIINSFEAVKEELCKTEIDKIIHELHTHQIELKMQNEDLKRVQLELEESRNRYLDLYDFAPVSYFTFDKSGIIKQLNLTAIKMLNIEKRFLINSPFQRFLATKSQDIFYLHLRKVISTRQKQSCELEIIETKDEVQIKKYDVQLESVLMHSNSEMIRSVMSDVTELKKKDRELRIIENELLAKRQIEELKNFYENIVETIQEGLWKIDRSGRTVYVNNQMAELLGYTIPEILGKTIFDFVDKSHLDFLKSRFENRKKGIKEKYEIRFVKKDGTKIFVTVSASPIIEINKNNEKHITGAIGLLTDITEQKNTENRLRESEEKYRTIVQYSNDLIWSEDIEGKLTFCNRRAEKLSGLSLSELIGKNFLDFIIKENVQRVKDLFSNVVNGQAVEYETKFRNRYNEVITIAVNKAPIYSKGKVVGATSFGRDITEQKASEEQLKNFAEKLKKSNKELEQFAYIASHDLQEPIRTISSYTELISTRYKGRLDSEADEFIDYIIYGTKRMQEMIEDLLQLSRIGTRGKPFEYIDINIVIKEVLQNLHELIEKNQAIISVDEMPIVNADFSQFVQLFQNLVDNAIKFRKPNEIPKIHIEAKYQKTEPPKWIFSVQDNGIGIDPRDFKKLFIIFQRLHSREEYPGTGIGLAICKKIVERHCGDIWVSSEQGKGSTFYFSIPVDYEKMNMKNNIQ